MVRRILVLRTLRHNWDPHHLQYRSVRSLVDHAKAFDKRLTSVQRVFARFGQPKLPNSLSIEVEKAKTLRGIAASLEGIHDTLRYLVGLPIPRERFARVLPVLTLFCKAHLPGLDPTVPPPPPDTPAPSPPAGGPPPPAGPPPPPAPGSASGSPGGSPGAANPLAGVSPSGASANGDEEEEEDGEGEEEGEDEEMGDAEEEVDEDEEFQREWEAEMARAGFL